MKKLDLKEYAARRSAEDPAFAKAYESIRIIGDLVKLRLLSGMTQAQLATRMGVSQPRVAEFEAMDGRRVSLEFASKYALAVGAKVVINSAAREATAKAVPVYKKPSTTASPMVVKTTSKGLSKKVGGKKA
jgi:DNA-binding XRE family transcriptional regulator